VTATLSLGNGAIHNAIGRGVSNRDATDKRSSAPEAPGLLRSLLGLRGGVPQLCGDGFAAAYVPVTSQLAVHITHIVRSSTRTPRVLEPPSPAPVVTGCVVFGCGHVPCTPPDSGDW
jgi:hypothetical protein